MFVRLAVILLVCIVIGWSAGKVYTKVVLPELRHRRTRRHLEEVKRIEDENREYDHVIHHDDEYH